MMIWDKNSPEINRIRPDKEKAKGLFNLIVLREKELATKSEGEFTPLIIEDYYEIIKELITAIMALDGYKSYSHELLVAYLAEHYGEFSRSEIALIDQMRRIRNDLVYRGVEVQPEFLERNKQKILEMIGKLKHILKKGME